MKYKIHGGKLPNPSNKYMCKTCKEHFRLMKTYRDHFKGNYDCEYVEVKNA